MKYSSEKKPSSSPSLKNWQAVTSPTSAMSVGSNIIRTDGISNLTNKKKQPEKQQKKIEWNKIWDFNSSLDYNM